MIKNLGLQLYTLRDYFKDEDFAALTFQKMVKLGYTEAHTAGKYGFTPEQFGKLANENGVKIIGVNKIEQTEKEAREYIEQLVDIACYDFSRVTEIEIPEEGVYKLRIDSVNKHVYKSVFEGIDITGLDGRYTSGAQIITFTVENDEIVKIENELEINGRIVKNYNSYGMGVDFFSTTVFN